MTKGRFAERLKLMRQEAEISRQQLADELHLTLVSYGDFERGRRYPMVEHMIRISEMLGTTPNELLGYKSLTFSEAEDFWQSSGYEVEPDEGGIVNLVREVEQEEFFKLKNSRLLDYKPPKQEKISFANRGVFIKYTQNAMKKFNQHIRDERKAFLDNLVSQK